MRHGVHRWLGGVGGLAAAAMVAVPAYAADVPTTAAPPPEQLQTFANPLPSPSLTPRQRMNERVDAMSQRIQQDIGAIFPGEDAPGIGTSITH
jgi:hypothetical protein